MKGQAVIVQAVRTPVGKFLGSLSSTPAPRLGAMLVKELLEKGQIASQDIDEIIMGQVLTAGCGQAPARQTALHAGLGHGVCATTIGRVCGSGLKAVMLANQAIRAGDAQMILAGGQENMSLAPHLLMDSRKGYRYGAFEAKDHMQWDGLTNPYDNEAMGKFGELCASSFGFSRTAQDDFAIESYRRSREASEKGYFKSEICALALTEKKKTVIFDRDEEPFSVDLEKLRTLSPAFQKENGTVTAGNSSSISDGAAILAVADEDFAKQRGLKPIARIVAQASYAQDPAWFTTAPIKGIEKVLHQAKLSLKDIDLFEINEAFAVVPMAAMKELSIPWEKVNVHGGAVSLGHPIGASGARILVTLIHALQRRGLKRGLASICIGGGESSNMIVELI